MSVILVSGKAGSGKTTFADYLTRTYPNKYISLALAAKLKTLTYKLLKIFNIPITSFSDLDDRSTKERYRSYMQLIGTEAMRSTFGDDFWCEQLLPSVEQYVSSGFNVIISDVRFPNEQDFFKSRFDDVKCIMIRRSSIDMTEVKHSSENTDNLHIDEVVFNDGDMHDFELLIDHRFAPKSSSVEENSDPIDEQLIDIPEPEAPIVERAMNTSTHESECDTINSAITKSETSSKVAANDSKFISMMTTNNDKNSSQQLGVIGERYVLELLQSIKPQNETILVSSMPHVADLHSIDYINNIFWVIEVKNKSNLTPEDVDKFRRDLERMTQQHANDKLKCIGLFLSLRSTSIPKIGDLYINGNEVYLSKSYFTPETVKIVFNFVEQYQNLLNAKNAGASTEPPDPRSTTTATIRPAFTAEDLELLALLNTEYQHLTRDIELYTSIRSNCSANLQHIEELATTARMKQRLIYCLNRQLSSSDDIIDRTTENIQYNAFIDYIKTQSNKNNIKKTLILQRFPALMTSINRIGWNEYRDEAWSTAKNEHNAASTASTASPPNEQSDDSNVILNDTELIQYIASLPNKNKLLKKDILANFPSTRKDIQTYGWTAFRDKLWDAAHVDNNLIKSD